MTVDGTSDDVDAAARELVESMVECDDFRGAYEREVQRIEEKNGTFFTEVFIEVEIVDNFVVSEYCVGSEVGSFFRYEH